MDHGQEVDGQLLEAGRHTPALFDPADALLDRASPAVGRSIEVDAAVVGMLIATPGDDRLDQATTF